MFSNTNRTDTRRNVIIGLVLAVAGAIAVSTMSNDIAGAATSKEVSRDCATNSPLLATCDFVTVQVKRDSQGPNLRVSGVANNCTSPVAATKSFSYSATVSILALVEDGHAIDGGGALDLSIVTVGQSVFGLEFKISGTREDITTSATLTGDVEPGHIGYIVFSERRLDVSGYLRGVYRTPVDGQTVFFSPREGAADVHVYYPKLLPDGRPDARIWLRNVPCGPDGSLASIEAVADSTVFDGFNANPQFRDVELPY